MNTMENYQYENKVTGYGGIAKKLVLIMGECSHVAKDGFNDFHKYSYASAAGVLETINAALVKHKVASVVTPAILNSFDVTNAKGNIEHQVTVGCNILLIDSESGESIDLYGIGTGQDAGDKAVMKAETAAIKYAYLHYYLSNANIRIFFEMKALVYLKAFSLRPWPLRARSFM